MGRRRGAAVGAATGAVVGSHRRHWRGHYYWCPGRYGFGHQAEGRIRYEPILPLIDIGPGIFTMKLGRPRQGQGLSLARLYGPAVRCKLNLMIWRRLVLRFCIRPLNGAFVLLAIMISAHIRSHSEKGPERPLVPPDHGCDGETVSPSPQSNSQTLAGELVA